MIDREKVIKGLETIKQFFGYGLPSTAEMFDSYYGILNDALVLLKKDEERFKQIESMNVTATGNGTAIGVVQGGLVIKRSEKEIHNVTGSVQKGKGGKME